MRMAKQQFNGYKGPSLENIMLLVIFIFFVAIVLQVMYGFQPKEEPKPEPKVESTVVEEDEFTTEIPSKVLPKTKPKKQK